MKTSLFLLTLFSVAASLMAADPSTNRVQHLRARHTRQTNAVPAVSKPAPKPDPMLGTRYDFNLSPGQAIVIMSTNSFTKSQAISWLQECIRTLR